MTGMLTWMAIYLAKKITKPAAQLKCLYSKAHSLGKKKNKTGGVGSYHASEKS